MLLFLCIKNMLTHIVTSCRCSVETVSILMRLFHLIFNIMTQMLTDSMFHFSIANDPSVTSIIQGLPA